MELREEHVRETRILSATDLLIYELANALRFKPGFDEVSVLRAIGDIMDLQIDLLAPSSELVEKTAEAAYLYDITVYDSCYLALGELMGVEVYTSDERAR